MSEAEIFTEALNRADGPERIAYLEGACAGNENLRKRVTALLRAHAEPDDVLDPLEPRPGTIDYRPIAEQVGTRIGPYKLLEQIGEGGFGLVFVAEQQEPVKRKVAIKIIKPGMDTRQVIARFEAERQALALMDHPNIAKVLDAGATNGEPGSVSSGRPYFVMELVRGIPITEYCDQNLLAPKERLELFITVCQAIQHAHQKGIIHRDIKPSNVLVTSHDGKPVAKVIDFGVAKAINQQLTERTLYTNFAQMIGTPLYMSPEQAEMSGLDIDTRSDIYSLGVVLYELLTGTTPLEKKRFREAAYDEIRRLIRDEDPPKPSTRISTSESMATVAAQRKTEPAKLSKLMRGDLDWITMKALEKDRTRRYETANGLARDIQRYLSDEPVEACPPSTAYRVRKFVRRHRGPVIAATVSLVVLTGLIAALVAATSSAMDNMRRAQEAEVEAHQNERLAIEERNRADSEKRKAELERDAKVNALAAEVKSRETERKARDQALTALRSMTNEIVENQLARGAELTDDHKEFLKKAVKQFESLSDLASDDAEGRAIRAEGQLRIGQIRHRLGDLKEAEAGYSTAIMTAESLPAELKNRTALLEVLASAHNSLGILFRDTGRLKAADAATRRAVELHRRLAAESPTRPKLQENLARCINNHAVNLRDAGKLSEADAALAEVIEIRNRLVASHPQSADYLQMLAHSLAVRGTVLESMGRVKDAEAALKRALDHRKRLVQHHASHPPYRADLAGSHQQLGMLFYAGGRISEAESSLSEALAIRRRLASEFPARPNYQLDLARSHASLAMVLKATGRRQHAEFAYGDALTIQKRLVGDFPNQSEFRQELAKTYNNLGLLLRESDRLNDADTAYQQALTLKRQLAADFPTQPDFRNDVAGTLVNLAILCSERKDFGSAKTFLGEAESHLKAALAVNPRHPHYRRYYSSYLSSLARANAGLLDQSGALAAAYTMRDLGWYPPVDAFESATALANCIPLVARHEKLDEEARQAAVRFYGDQVLILLRDSKTKGYKPLERLRKDRAFEPLRQRDDFKNLLAELEAASASLAPK